MNEKLIPEIICDYLSGIGGVAFVPEAWRDGCAAVFLSGGERYRKYIDGSATVSVPFEVRIRAAGRSLEDRLSAVRLFANIDRHIDAADVSCDYDGITEIYIKAAGGVRRSAVYENGSEEYTAPYMLSYYKCRAV